MSPLTALAVANLAAWAWQRRRGIDAGPALWRMTVWGFVAARAAFVFKHFDTYLAAPLSMLDIRDGGFVAFAGLLAACAAGFEQLRRQPALRRPLLGAALAGILVWAGTGLAIQASQPASSPLPELAFRRLDGSAVRLAEFKGKPVVLNLWATWCPPCRREMPAMAAAQAASPDVAFVFVNAGEEPDTVRRYLAAQGLSMPNLLLDGPRALAPAVGAAGYPTTLFYDRRGMLAGRHLGELSRAALDEQLSGLRKAP
ncbi:TlpA disulfide reductase family protein [Massilia litorea]|uniref:TlpA disulfide reductase family protein n=1 Tax=Massilia litorea TaxID=2769491 RepID=UPI001D0CFE47|nr:TlpA disulfide reductase family protein [Massilia litorea]